MAESNPFGTLRADLSGRGDLQSREAQQIVGSTDQVGSELGLGLSDEARLAQSTHGLHPAEDFLDALPFPLAHGIARMARGPCIEAQRGATLDSSDVRPPAVRPVWRR